jgi:hypothetical protein
MKAAFLTAILFGFGGVLAAAHYVPWMSHDRLPSQTTVVANGGRAEQFVIRLPVDRLAATGAADAGMRAAPLPDGKPLPADLAGQPMLIEHFKVRDASGNVIGVAARHWSSSGREAGTAWSLLIPSRGSLLLTAPGEGKAALDAALAKAGYSAGKAWNGSVAVTLGRDDDGVIASGSAEFDGLEGSYSEVWTVTGVSELGELRGTVELNTVTRRGS